MTKKKILAVILARVGSSRLKNKMMLKIGNKMILKIFIDRLRKTKNITDFIIATSSNKKDIKIVNFAKKEKIDCIRGPEKNVLKRIILSINHTKKNPDLIIRANADNVLLMPSILDNEIKKMIREKKWDLSTPFDNNYCPFGYSLTIFKSKTLLKIQKNTKRIKYLEHVENYCLDYSTKFKILRPKHPKKYFFPGLKLSLDTYEDLKKIKFYYKKIKNIDITKQPAFLIRIAKRYEK